MASRKRKCDEESGSQLCVIHCTDSNKNFVLLSKCKGPENRLDKLKDICTKRLSQPADSPHRMEDACKCLPDEILPHHGYHIDCYKKFTAHLDRLKCPTADPTQQQRSSGRSSGDATLFEPDCIFCNKKGKKATKIKGTWTTETTSSFECEGWKMVVETAEKKNDEKLLRRIRGFDLFACEAQYHPACRKAYIRDPSVGRSTDETAKRCQEELEQSHKVAFERVSEIIDYQILQHQKIVRLSLLCDAYTSSLEETEHANQEYRASKLKRKLEKSEKYGHRLSFTSLEKGAKFQSLLVYNSKMKTDRAVTLAYELGSGDMVKEVAMSLRRLITEAYEKSESLPWPPTEEFLQQHDVLPDQLKIFLNFLLAGKAQDQTVRVRRLASSLGQDICRAVTRGQWKLPKHVLLCTTLRHLFRSEQLTTILNRFGHCESYRFSLEVETAIAQALQISSTVLSSQIILHPSEPSLFHSEFDNFDLFLNTVEGQSSIHTAHGIMLQETPHEQQGGEQLQLPSVPRTKEQSVEVPQEELPDCYVTTRKSPNYPCVHTTIPGGQEAQKNASRIHLLWILARLHSAIKQDQDVPGWAGFISLIGEKPEKKTTIGYYPVINNPITDYKTVQECLRLAESATHEVGQDYVVTTFDLGVCMKAYPITWSQPQKYQQHIILMGTFHTACAYFRMVGKKMEGSGLSDIMQEAGLITSGSISGVMSGKSYDRAMHCHTVILECLERLLLKAYLQKEGAEELFPTFSTETVVLLETTKRTSKECSVQKLLGDEEMKKFMTEYELYKEGVRAGKHGKTAQLWVTYMDHIWLVLTLLHSVKVNDFELYAQVMLVMPDLFFSYGGQNYARYLTFFGTFLANLDLTHPGAKGLLRRGAFSVARSFIPGNRCCVDKTMEETFMRHAKSRGGSAAGLVGITSNFQAYQRWVRTAHDRMKYVQATLDLADMSQWSEFEDQYRGLRPSEVIKSEDSVARATNAVESFLNPFQVDQPDKLVILSSGASVPAEIEKDVLQAEVAGKTQKESFVADRLKKNSNFFDPVKKLRLKTLASLSKKVVLRSTDNKVTAFHQQGNVAFQLLVKSQEGKLGLDLKDLMTFQLTPVPYSIATADNFMAKTDKSAGFHYLTKGVENADFPSDNKTLTVIDGNAIFHSMTQVPTSFRQICLNVFEFMPKTTDFVMSTDMYQDGSIKSMERKRRGSGDKIILSGDSMKRPGDWAAFLANDENKSQFIRLLLEVWSRDAMADKLKGRNVVLVSEGKAYKLTSSDGIKTERELLNDLTSSQEETDSRIILYCQYGLQNGYKTITVKSPDSDVFFILLHYAGQLGEITLLFDTGKANKKRLLNITALAEELTRPHCSALLSLHAFTGCDSVSTFKGKGKVKAVKILQQKPKFVETFRSMGESWEMKKKLLDELEEFTCSIYGRHRFQSVDAVRHQMLVEKCDSDGVIQADLNIDLATFPPCHKSLKQHARRANYQTAIWKRAHLPLPEIPNPTDGHGWMLNNGILEPLWTEEHEELVLSQTVIDDLLNEVHKEGEEEEEEAPLFQNGLDDSLETESDCESD